MFLIDYLGLGCILFTKCYHLLCFKIIINYMNKIKEKEWNEQKGGGSHCSADLTPTPPDPLNSLLHLCLSTTPHPNPSSSRRERGRAEVVTGGSVTAAGVVAERCRVGARNPKIVKRMSCSSSSERESRRVTKVVTMTASTSGQVHVPLMTVARPYPVNAGRGRCRTGQRQPSLKP